LHASADASATPAVLIVTAAALCARCAFVGAGVIPQDVSLTSGPGAEHAFDFEGLYQINSREAFVERLPMLSQASKNFFVLSSRYFDTKTHGDVQLVGDLVFFSKPVQMGGFDLSIQTPSFSFTCWIKTTRTFGGGYLIRKRPSQTSDLTCWGWYLDARCYVCVCARARASGQQERKRVVFIIVTPTGISTHHDTRIRSAVALCEKYALQQHCAAINVLSVFAKLYRLADGGNTASSCHHRHRVELSSSAKDSSCESAFCE
jgi:hypothetical protein